MKRIANIRICVDELDTGAFIAWADLTDPLGQGESTGDPIYGNTLKQLRQRIGKRLEKLIVEEDGKD